SSSTYRSGPSCSLFPVVRFTAVHHNKEAAKNQQGGSSRRPYDVGDHRAITTGLRVIVIAIQQYLVHQCSNFVLRRFDQAEANVFRGKLDPIVILGQLAGRRYDHDGCGVNELSSAWIAPVAETYRVGELLDFSLLAGQEVPARAVGLVFQMLVHARDVNLLFVGGVLRSLVRV